MRQDLFFDGPAGQKILRLDPEFFHRFRAGAARALRTREVRAVRTRLRTRPRRTSRTRRVLRTSAPPRPAGASTRTPTRRRSAQPTASCWRRSAGRTFPKPSG
jgi:hypothetical protein